MNAARQYTVFCKANIRPLYCSLTAASPEHTSLMISTISLHVCVFVVCFSVVMINCTPREYQLLRFARKENTHPSTGCLLTLSEKQRRAARFLALASFFFFCSSGALYFLICFSLCRNAAISPISVPRTIISISPSMT